MTTLDTTSKGTVLSPVAMIHDPVLVAKLLTGGGAFQGYHEGTLSVSGRDLDWSGDAEVIHLREVTGCDVFRPGLARVDGIAEDGATRTVVVQDRTRGLRHVVPATAALAEHVRVSLGIPASPTAARAMASAGIVAAEARLTAGRARLVIGAVVATIGLIATGYSQSHSDGGTWTFYWGAVVVGVLWSLAGAADYFSGKKDKAKAIAASTIEPAAPPAPMPAPPTALVAAVAEPDVVEPEPEVVQEPQPKPELVAAASVARLGIRFDIDRLDGGSSYGLHAWQEVWDAMTPVQLGPARLFEGDSAATLAGHEHVFCIAVEGRSDALGELRHALEVSDEFRRDAATPAFADASELKAEPLVPAGAVGDHGEVEGMWPAAGLNAVHHRLLSFTPPSAVPAPTQAPRHRRFGPRSWIWAVVAAVAVLALVFAFTRSSGGGRADDARLAFRSTVEAKALALARAASLEPFGDPAVTGVSCPSVLPSAAKQPFTCGLQLTNDADAQMLLSFTDAERTLTWCSIASKGRFVLNLQELGGACAGAATGTTTPTTTPTTARTVTTPAPPRATTALTTGAGTLRIASVKLTDRYPYDCVEGGPAGCLQTEEAKLVVLELDPPDGSTANGVMTEIQDETFNATIEANGERVRQVYAMWGGSPDRIELVYEIGEAHPPSLILHWPGNDAVRLSY